MVCLKLLVWIYLHTLGNFITQHTLHILQTQISEYSKISWNPTITAIGSHCQVLINVDLNQSLFCNRKPRSILPAWLTSAPSGLTLFVPVTSSQSSTSSGWSASRRTSWSSTESGTCLRTLCVPSWPTTELVSKWTSRSTRSNRGSGHVPEISQWNTDWWSQTYIRGRGRGFLPLQIG